MTEQISTFCLDLRLVQDIMRVESEQRNLWKDTIFPGLHISPILGDLLTSRPLVDGVESASVVLEAFRLAAVLYVSNLRAKFGIDTLSAGPHYASKLRVLLSLHLNQCAPPALLIWILSVAFSSQCLPEQQVWLVTYLMMSCWPITLRALWV